MQANKFQAIGVQEFLLSFKTSWDHMILHVESCDPRKDE
jgi:hypothetical protein